MRNNKIVLMFHDVYENSPFESGFSRETSNLFKVERKMFSLFLGLLETKLQSQRRPKTDAVFTFDDGGKSSLWIANALSEKGFVGHFFIVTSLIGTEFFCTKEELIKIAKQGHVLGTHSHSHPEIISKLTDEELLKEWKTSKNILQGILGYKIQEASIPAGFYSNNMGNIISNLGVKKIYTSSPTKRIYTIGNSEVIGRFTIRNDYPIESYLKYFDRFSWMLFRIRIRWFVLAGLKKIFGNTYLKFRQYYYQTKS